MAEHTSDAIGSFINRLKESGEGAFNKLSEQLLETPVFLDAMRRTIETKGHVDRTMSGALDFVNLPSKNDVQRLLEGLDTIAASVRKQERTIAALEHQMAVVKALVEKLTADLHRAKDSA